MIERVEFAGRLDMNAVSASERKIAVKSPVGMRKCLGKATGIVRKS